MINTTTLIQTTHQRQNVNTDNRNRILFFYLSLIFFVLMFGVSRLVLVAKVVAADLDLQAVCIDLLMAVFIAVLVKLLHAIHLAAAVVFLILASCLHIADMEMAAALNTVINIGHLPYASDVHFIQGSLSNLTFPLYTFLMLASALVYLIASARVTKNKQVKAKYLLTYAFLLILGMYILTPQDAEWHSANMVWLSLSRSISNLNYPYDNRPAAESDAVLPGRQQMIPGKEGRFYFGKPVAAQRNILFVVLEGIPGVYIRQVQEWTGVNYPIEMPNLSSIAERSIVVPNFIAHNRQTIRGLYSLLSGDYCRLSLKTPKIYEYIGMPPESRPSCLPHILKAEGYTTAYMQAADLAYMSKDQFMPAAGFDQVLGKDHFSYQHVPFSWGPDDKAFFEQAADFIETLNQRSNPWFVTLLNVGTHHPYAIPKEMEERFSNRKEAAVSYLDQAIGAFIQRLEATGITDNTLILFLSDESHGVTGQPYSRNWGLAAAYTPESEGRVNPAVFGLIDIPYSILDYLDLTGVLHSFPKRSIFREQHTERSILFDSYFCEKKGVVERYLDRNRVEIIRSANGELFSNSYDREIVAGQRGRELAAKLKTQQKIADSSLYDSQRKERNYLLLENDEYTLEKMTSKLLSSGQYLDIPAKSTVTVELKASVRLNTGGQAYSSAESIRLILQMRKWYKKMPIPQINIPVLRDGDSLQLSFSFGTNESLTRVWAYLQAISVNSSCSARLKIERFSIEVKESKSIDDFQMNHFLIKEKKGISSIYTDFLDVENCSNAWFAH